MKTPKEQAAELVNKFLEYSDSNYAGDKFENNWGGIMLAGERRTRLDSAKQCALICVDAIISHNQKHLNPEDYYARLNELEEVKNEIEKYGKNYR